MLTNRWAVLALLFLVRAGMGVQFQVVPSLAPLVIERFAVSLAEIGLLIGIYQAPGIFLSLPGGALARRFGDKPVVLVGLALMVAGGLLMLAAPGWHLYLAGRIVAGAGAIVMNVLMTKMVADWFSGRELNTAMAIFVNSWPCGIALALVVLPPLAAAGGLSAAMVAATVYCAAAFVGTALLYSAPETAPRATVSASGWPEGRVIFAVLVAAVVWGLYNTGLSVVFSFGPLMMAERGYSIVEGSALTSLVLWVATLSIPLGGFLADRSGRPGVVMAVSLAGFALALVIAPRTEAVMAAFLVMGLIGGLAAGPVMSLAASVLTPQTRASGMGIFFTLYYVFLMGAPWLAGLLATAVGTARIAFDAGAAALVLAFPVWGAFVLLRRVALRTAG
ncbi:CynX/NimT family MFS transporter [Seohaeicola nanhaiensis]|uniref:CynX/NimT family MFS transporter n=1 Tax=Seohaeicola nanhaiensis TaxID=1387282 RepID=A0ABV9KMN2_9RHOB